MFDHVCESLFGLDPKQIVISIPKPVAARHADGVRPYFREVPLKEVYLYKIPLIAFIDVF